MTATFGTSAVNPYIYIFYTYASVVCGFSTEICNISQMVEYLVGDGPNNRYALICSQCHSHNGMALRDEFEYLNFRCAYCYHLNPARKKKPTLEAVGGVDSTHSTAGRDRANSSSKDDTDSQQVIYTPYVSDEVPDCPCKSRNG